MNKKLIKVIIPLIITILLLYIFLRKVSFQEMKSSLMSISITGLFLFVFLSLLGSIFRTLRYKILLSGKLSFKNLFLITLIRNFSVDLLPARTASLVFYTYFTNREGISIEEGGSSFIVSMLYDIISLSILLSIAFIYIKTENNSFIFYTLIFIMFFVSVFLLYVSLPIIKEIEKIKIIKKNKKLKSIVENLSFYFSKHSSNKERIRILLLSILIRGLKYTSLFILFKEITNTSFSIKNLSFFSFGLSATEVSAIIPIQGIAGFGTWELAFKYVFNVLGINLKNPFLLGLIIHSITQLWEYSIGIIAFLIMFYEGKKPYKQ